MRFGVALGRLFPEWFVLTGVDIQLSIYLGRDTLPPVTILAFAHIGNFADLPVEHLGGGEFFIHIKIHIFEFIYKNEFIHKFEFLYKKLYFQKS